MLYFLAYFYCRDYEVSKSGWPELGKSKPAIIDVTQYYYPSATDYMWTSIYAYDKISQEYISREDGVDMSDGHTSYGYAKIYSVFRLAELLENLNR